LQFGAIFAEAWNRVITLGNAVIGFTKCGIFSVLFNSSESVHVHIEVSDTEVVPQAMIEKIAEITSAVRSDGIAPETCKAPQKLQFPQPEEF
jgi:hypothetical protein